jgi:tRNA (mo5U34)-methyltransferase
MNIDQWLKSNLESQAYRYIQQERELRSHRLDRPALGDKLSAIREVSHLKAKSCDFTKDAVRIGDATEVSPEEQKMLKKNLLQLLPWRKGPFDVFGIHIDSEWQSYKKWNRVLPKLPPLQGKVIADIGCSNGYYMYRMLPYQPEVVFGFEPTIRFHLMFKMLNGFADQENLFHELLGVEHIAQFKECFDVIFLMGILYHHPEPMRILSDVKEALKPGGVLIVETQGIPGKEPVALFPEKRYAKVPGTYFVPTVSCLQHWLERSKYGSIDIFYQHPMNSGEQRKSEWMPFESYDDFIDPKDSTKTVEGYPAPIRIYLRAVK